MSAPEPFQARVTRRPPGRRDVVAPERDVATGRYQRGVDREDKHRREHEPELDDRVRQRRGRPRRVRPWQLAAAVGAAAAAVVVAAVLGAAGDDDPSESAPSSTEAATVATASTEADAGPSGTAATPATAAVVTSTTEAATTTVTVVPTTTLVPVEAANGLAGEYSFTMTIADGNSNFPVGTTQDVGVSFVAECAGAGCTVTSPEYNNASWAYDGTALSASIAASEPCPRDPGISVDTVIDVSLEVDSRDADGRPEALSGTQTQSATGAATCPNTENDPITWSITATRTG